jgi:hypothetical protein
LSIVYFTDRDLGKRFPEILKTAGLLVELHEAHFKHDCPDATWLAEVGSRGWVVLTHDRRIRYKANELEAVTRHDVRLLTVVGKAPLPELARAFVRTVPRIERFLSRNPAPLIAKVYRPSPEEMSRNAEAPGRIERWYPPVL